MKVRKGDRVRVLTGKHRGHEGEVIAARPAEGTVLVDGITAKKHQKPTRATQQGGIIDKEVPIDASNVALLSPSDGRPTRVGYRTDPDGTKVRVCKRTGAEL